MCPFIINQKFHNIHTLKENLEKRHILIFNRSLIDLSIELKLLEHTFLATYSITLGRTRTVYLSRLRILRYMMLPTNLSNNINKNDTGCKSNSQNMLKMYIPKQV